MAEPENMVLKLLREMRTDLERLRHDMAEGFSASRIRDDDLNKQMMSLRQALNGESIMGRYMVAEVEDRLELLEKRLAALEQRGQ